MARDTEIILSKDNLLHNINVIKERVGSARIISMVKANAYGHGAKDVAYILRDHTDMFAV